LNRVGSTGDVDRMTIGTQILREFVCYNHFDLVGTCKAWDPKMEGALTHAGLKQALGSSSLIFAPKVVDNIFQDCPKNFLNQADYVQLAKIIKNAPPPVTYHSL
jgi:hypothetical protein